MELEDEAKLEDGMKVEASDRLRDVKDIKVKPKGRTLIVMGTYSIGKERIVKGELSLVHPSLTSSRGQSTGLEDLLRPAEKGNTALSNRSGVARVDHLGPH
jgi:hypothetical protein